VTWDNYASSKAAIVPIIVKADYYDDAVDDFVFNLTFYGVAVEGFAQ
jgi:hypothetical protein